ncbi:MAG: hypothetical protein HC875_21615 [Anaerolineales bacterium]|nr:hypothetical protein [Anaerolineales bacterium]
MSCKLEAFILNHKAADMLPGTLRHLHHCRLDDRLALIPVTRQLYQEVVATFGEARDDPYPMFFALAPALAELAAQISSASPVLYLEVDVANGIGDQTAVVWHQGQVAYGPSEGRFFVARR